MQPPTADVAIRPARSADLAALGEIEVVAGRAFIDVGMPTIAGDVPQPVAVLAEYQRDGRAWVAVDASDAPVGYVLADLVDGNGHVEQVSVHPDWAGRRLGSRLIDAVEDWARGRRLSALTLTTFTEVPWNGPYYSRLGFEPVADAELTPGLRGIRDEERANGIDVGPRTVMRRPVG